jgi:pimeloyl-ACP methyl ester carboxylesterase
MTIEHATKHVRANGIDIHYVEAGAGDPLLIINNGMISTHPMWNDWPSAHTRYMTKLVDRFRVINTDLRGSGRTKHTGGPIPYELLADDVLALIDALGLEQPFIWGYGDGGAIATMAEIRRPRSVRAIANHGGYTPFNPDPQAPVFVMTRQMLGGSRDATRADVDGLAGSSFEFLRNMVALMKADHDVAQGTGHWKTVLGQTFDRCSRPASYTFESLRAVTVPTLILVGDRDRLCAAEESVIAYRALPHGELAIIPNAAGGITAPAVEITIDFFARHARNA